MQQRTEKSKPLLRHAYEDLQKAVARHQTVTALKSDPEISGFFSDAHDLARTGADLTRKDIRLYKKKFKLEREPKVFQISLYA